MGGAGRIVSGSSARPDPQRPRGRGPPQKKKKKKKKKLNLKKNVFKGGGDPASVKQLVYFANCCLNCCAEQSHKDDVRSTAVEEKLKQKLVQLSEPSSTSVLWNSPGLS